MQLKSLRKLADAHGLLIRRDLAPDAVSRKAWRHAHDVGLLVRLHHGVSRLADAPESPRQQIAAAIAAARPGAGTGRLMAAGRTSAYLLGAKVEPCDPIHLAVKARAAPAPLVGVRVHRPRNMLDLVANDMQGIPTCRPVRALLDVAAWDPHLTSEVLEQFIVDRTITIDDARKALDRYSKQGRPGLKVLRATVEAWAAKQRPPDSVLEARFAKLRRDFDLPEFEFQRPVDRYRPDFCRTAEMVIVECDGFTDHGRRQEQIERDDARDAELASQGWVVMRFTWHQINRRSAWVAARIHATLRTRAAQLARAS